MVFETFAKNERAGVRLTPGSPQITRENVPVKYWIGF